MKYGSLQKKITMNKCNVLLYYNVLTKIKDDNSTRASSHNFRVLMEYNLYPTFLNFYC